MFLPTTTKPLGAVAPTGGLFNPMGAGTGLKLPTSATAATTTAATGLTGLQLGLQPGQTGLSLPKPAANVATGGGPAGLQLSGLQQSGLKLPQPAQTGLTGQLGLSQPQIVPAAGTPSLSLGIRPQSTTTGLTGKLQFFAPIFFT